MLRIGLFLALVVPVLEIWLIIQVGQAIGGVLTAGLLIAGSLLGSWLMRREGRRAWAALQNGLRSGSAPDRELADSAMLLAGGALLLIPGFLTDVFGLLLILPLTRPVARRGISWFLDRRMRLLAQRSPYGGLYEPPGDAPRPAKNVVPGQVITGEGETRR
ncbi:FxsA family protein [Acrocarpospora catenulata]|uniref:FxsA family protein n=1 Tax=Acrocarpospora catenulata TaxID=2836182 RepID=UPI001BD9F116|nr:FxsA family protein [Acrocarpospora catenulata]